MNGVNLRALEIFRAVAIEGSVSKAASKLNRVQSNISTRLKQLEEQLGQKLFVRKSHGLSLTTQGSILLRYADRLFELSMEATEAVRQTGPKGRFRIGAMESTAAARLPSVLSRYHQLYPDVQIEIETDTAGGLMKRLQNYDVEAIFAAEPIKLKNIETRAVFEERLILVTPASFPGFRNIEEISGRTIIAFEEGCAYRRYLQQWLLEKGITPGGMIAVGSYLSMLACVSAGTGYAVVPKSVLDVIGTRQSICRHTIPGKMSRIKTMLAWRSNYSSPKLEALRALFPK
jgi:DNA-binding transcriptional LysR family regulator